MSRLTKSLESPTQGHKGGTHWHCVVQPVLGAKASWGLCPLSVGVQSQGLGWDVALVLDASL